MKLERIALLAEVVSAAAILITLIFVVVELRDSTRAQDAATFQEMSRDVQAIFDRLPVELRVKVRQRDPLSLEESMEYQLYTRMTLRIGESWWYQWQRGTISQVVLESYITHVHAALNDQVARDIWRNRRGDFMPGYQSYIDAYLSDSPLQ